MAENAPTLDSVINSVCDLVAAGASLHWLVPREKRPIAENWSEAPFLDLEGLKSSYRKGANIGIRLGEPSKTDAGYIHLIDLDIRKAELAHEALSALRELLPECDTLPCVISGSGGHSRHFYFVTDKPFRKRKLAKSTTFSYVHDPRLNKEVKKNDWEIDLLGTGSQAVLPPSIHPDTGLPYKWPTPFDFDLFDLGITPHVTSERVTSWGATGNEHLLPEENDEDDLLTIVRTAPLDLEEGELSQILEDLPPEWAEDRDSWVTVGAALHHQFGGTEEGYETWCEWSQQSEKYDPKTQKSVWKSFKGNRSPVTFRTVIQAAQEHRLQQNLPVLVEERSNSPENDLEDLLGGPISSKIDKIGPETPKIDPEWTSYLDRNEEGHPKSCLHNISLIVQNDIRTFGCLALNEFTQEIVLVNTPKKVTKKRDSAKNPVNLSGQIWTVTDPVNGEQWTDTHDDQIRKMIEAPRTQAGYGIKVSDRDLKSAINIVASENRFHPVRNYMKYAVGEWDGVPRAETLFIDYLAAEDTPYHREAARLFLMGAVVRIFEPGHKFDFVPILEGLQGKRKSTFIRLLGRSWFSELSGDFSNLNQMVEQIQGSWIIEIPELQGFSRADTNVLKAWVSRQKDKARLAYDRRARVFPRQCVFVGSTNDEEYLRDHTGGRRFWPISCELGEDEDIDTERLEGEVDQVWAEAYQMYLELRASCKLTELPLYLKSKEARDEAAMLQDSRRVESAEEVLAGEIEAWVNTPIGSEDGFDDLDEDAPPVYRNAICAAQVWCEMLGRDRGTMGTAEATRVGRALGQVDGFMKFSKHQVRTSKYGKQRVFIRKTARYAQLELIMNEESSQF